MKSDAKKDYEGKRGRGSKKESGAKKDCAEVMSLIPVYLKGDLTLHDAKRFTRHLKKCEDCREEIEISYLLGEGMTRVESGETIDLHADLQEMLQGTEDAIQHLIQFRTAVYLMEATAVFVLIACVLITGLH